MIASAIGLPQDRSGVYGRVQDWLQAHGVDVYEPQRRYGDGTLFNEWSGAEFGFKPDTLAMMRQQPTNMLLHCGSYYYALKPQILRRAIPALPAMRRALDIPRPWLLIDEPPHSPTYGWTQDVEDVVADFVGAAMTAGFEVGVCMPGPTQLAFWRERITPSWWIVHDKHPWPPMPGCWLYNAGNYNGLADRLRATQASGYLQWSGVKTTKGWPVPVLFDIDGDAYTVKPEAWQLVSELEKAERPPTLEERLTALERRVAALESK